MVTFSIITPIYNTSSWLHACVKSIINQSFSDWELILIDDGSTDDSLNICESFSNLDSRIKLIKQSNQGVVAARYNGFLVSSGNFVLFLDSDDKLKLEALEKFANELSVGNYDLLRFGFDYCDLKWNITKTILPPYQGSIDQRTLMVNHQRPLKQYSSSSIWDKVYCRSLISKVFSLTKERHIRHSEDMLFSLTALILSQNTLFMDKSFYLYLQRPGSAIHALNPNSISDKESYIEGLFELSNILPKEYHNGLDGLIQEESNDAIGYILYNGSNYGLSYSGLCLLIFNLRSSAIYRSHVKLKSLKPKYLIRDLLFQMAPIFSLFLMLRVKIDKIKSKFYMNLLFGSVFLVSS